MVALRIIPGYQQLVVLSVLMFGQGMTEEDCPGPPEMYIKRKPSLMCRKYFNCEPGNEILPCQNQCEPERCARCQEGRVQPYLIHSDSGDEERKCFKPRNVCSDLENIATRYPSDAACVQSKAYCECDVYNCYYGNPCICSRQIPECQENEYLVVHNMKSAECLPCPAGTYKPEKGCQPCRVKEETGETMVIKKGNTSVIADVTRSHSTTTLTSTTEKQLSTLGGQQTTQKPQNRESIPVDLIIGLSVSVVAISVAAILICCVLRRSRRGQVCLYSCMDVHVCCERQLMIQLPAEEIYTSSSDTDVKVNPADDVNQNSVPQSPMEETENPLPAHPNEFVRKPGKLVLQTGTINSDTVSASLLSKLTLETNFESTLSSETPHVTQELSMGQMNPENEKKDLKVVIDMEAVNGSEHQSSECSSFLLNTKVKGQEHEEDTERKIPIDTSEADSSGYKSAALLVPGDSSSSHYIDIKGSGKCKEENVKLVTEQCSPDENTKLLDEASVEVGVSDEGKENEEETQPKLLYEREDNISGTFK